MSPGAPFCNVFDPTDFPGDPPAPRLVVNETMRIACWNANDPLSYRLAIVLALRDSAGHEVNISSQDPYHYEFDSFYPDLVPSPTPLPPSSSGPLAVLSAPGSVYLPARSFELDGSASSAGDASTSSAGGAQLACSWSYEPLGASPKAPGLSLAPLAGCRATVSWPRAGSYRFVLNVSAGALFSVASADVQFSRSTSD
eukprot:tig00020603_g11816.t1